MIKLLFLLLSSSIVSSHALGAACCGGSFASPSLIAGDDLAQTTLGLLTSEVAADVYTDGRWRKRSDLETHKTLVLEAAHVFWDRWQAGFSLPIIERARAKETSTGLGDTNVSLGYEYLPDWTYSYWRPKGIGYLKLTLPTGRSIQESEATYALDSRGRGFWAIGAGTLLSKVLGAWDGFSNIEVHHSFSKSVETEDLRGQLDPSWGASSSVGLGYSFKSSRIGATFSYNYEDPINFLGDTDSFGTEQASTTVGVSFSYLYSSSWAVTLSYTDQTIFGEPVNTSLLQTFSLRVQRRWPR